MICVKTFRYESGVKVPTQITLSVGFQPIPHKAQVASLALAPVGALPYGALLVIRLRFSVSKTCDLA